jgi:hypothetical protein
MVMGYVLFEVGTEYLNIFEASFGFERYSLSLSHLLRLNDNGNVE